MRHDGDRVRLSRGERLMLVSTFAGLSTKEIAQAQGLTPATVDQYMARVLNGTSVSGRRGLARYVLENTDLFALDKGVLHEGAWSGVGRHPEGCQCSAIYCTVMRLQSDPGAIEAYRRRKGFPPSA